MTSKSKQISANFCPIELIRKYIHAEARAVCYLQFCQCRWKQETGFTYCITFSQQLPGPPAQRVCSVVVFFFFSPSMRTMGCKKIPRQGEQQIQDWGHFSSNCLITGEWFPLSHYLTGRRRGRQMWLSRNEPSPGRMCRGTRGVIPCYRPVICFTPVLIFLHDQ